MSTIIIDTDVLEDAKGKLEDEKTYYKNKQTTFNNIYGRGGNLVSFLASVRESYLNTSDNISNVVTYIEDYKTEVETLESKMSSCSSIIDVDVPDLYFNVTSYTSTGALDKAIDSKILEQIRLLYLNNDDKLKEELANLNLYLSYVPERWIKEGTSDILVVKFANGIECEYRVLENNKLLLLSGYGTTYDPAGREVRYEAYANDDGSPRVKLWFDVETGLKVYEALYYQGEEFSYENQIIQIETYYDVENGGKRYYTNENNQFGNSIKKTYYNGDIITKSIVTTYGDNQTILNVRSSNYLDNTYIDTIYDNGKKQSSIRYDSYGNPMKIWNWDETSGIYTIEDYISGEKIEYVYEGEKNTLINYYQDGVFVRSALPSEIIANNIVDTALAQEGAGGYTYYSYMGYEGRVPWCACFVSWVAAQNNVSSDVVPRSGLVDTFYDFYEDKGLLYQTGSYTPKPGDIAIFSGCCHIGYVEKVENDIVYTIEGNCSDLCKRYEYDLKTGNMIGGSMKISYYGSPEY